MSKDAEPAAGVRTSGHVPADGDRPFGHAGDAVAGFTTIGSEDRFSLGLGNEPVTMVADIGRKAEAMAPREWVVEPGAPSEPAPSATAASNSGGRR